jgi:hypothetical protein
MIPFAVLPQLAEAVEVSVSEPIDALGIVPDNYHLGLRMGGCQADKGLIRRVEVLIFVNLKIDRGKVRRNPLQNK